MSAILSQATDRASRINRISKGIKEQTISNADLLSLAAESAAKKRHQHKQASVPGEDAKNLQSSFIRDICDAASKENVPNLKAYPASPYKAMGSYLLKSNRFHETSEEDEMIVSDFKIPETESQDITSIVNEEITLLKRQAEEESARARRPPATTAVEATHQEQDMHDEMPLPDVDYPIEASEQKQPQFEELKQLLTAHLLQVLNHGSFEELTALQGIGKVRAMKIFTERNAGCVFASLDDLEVIGMNHKNIQRFASQNLGTMVAK